MASKDQTYDSIALARVCQLIEWLKDVAKGRGDVRPPDLPHDNPLDEKHALIFSYAQKSAFEVSDTIKELQKQQTQDPRRMQVAIQQQDQHQIQDSQQQSKASSVQESSVNRSPSGKNVDKEAINNLQEQLREQNFKFEETKKALSEEIHSLKTEKDNLMARMSKMGPRKNTYRNPSICDLIHPPRPQSVAEQYEELYDSEWTDAMELFNPIGDDKVEQQSIGILADILKFCYDESEKVADQQLSKMRTECFSLTSQENPQIVTEKLLMGKLKDNAKKIPNYTNRCIRVCWSMVTHTPRMGLLWPDIKDRKINHNMFKFYTKMGDTLDYVVWPAMLSYKDVPLLKKGIVQPVPK